MRPNFLTRIEQIGISSGDDVDTRLQKSLMVTGTLMSIAAGISWGILYILLGALRSGLIPLLYGIFSTMSVFAFAITRKFQLYRFTQLCLILLLPFFLQVSLGGFVNSSAVILWALICPLSALMFGHKDFAPYWFLAFLGLILLSSLLQPFVQGETSLSQITIITFFALNLSGVSAIVFIQFQYFTILKDRAYALLGAEQAKSEKLLLNVLPKEIAPLLKEDPRPKGRTIAEHFEAISILFADVVGFTSLSVELTPEEMVELLNEVFSYFDLLVEKYDIEKIRTIGDNYMVVSGAPKSRPDHASALARFALEMLHFQEFCTNPAARLLQFRVGINSGPAVAGVLGYTKFHYDVWGDAVNIASRMESQGVAGKIQIAQPTYDLIKNKFLCSPRGILEIKGKGQMATWFLEEELQ